MKRNQKKSLTYVQYRDLCHDYRGYGVLVSEDQNFFNITNIIGATFINLHSKHLIEELPKYSMIKADCEWFTLNNNPLKVPDWVYKFAVNDYTVDEIHHIGLFFEWFFYSNSALNERLEKCIDVSMLDAVILKPLIHFIIDHQKDDIGLVKTALSPTIQKILFKK